MRRSESDDRPESSCFEILLPCTSSEMTHIAACVSISGKGAKVPKFRAFLCFEMLLPCTV